MARIQCRQFVRKYWSECFRKPSANIPSTILQRRCEIWRIGSKRLRANGYRPFNDSANSNMQIERDFKELLLLLNSHRLEYLVVGAYALAFHGAPRFTGDLDVFVRPDSANAARLMDALTEFGFGSVGLSRKDFEQPDQVVQLGVPPVRVDLITGISGVSWDEADAGAVHANLDDVPVRFIGRDHLVINKRAAGRKKDLADLEALGED